MPPHFHTGNGWAGRFAGRRSLSCSFFSRSLCFPPRLGPAHRAHDRGHPASLLRCHSGIPRAARLALLPQLARVPEELWGWEPSEPVTVHPGRLLRPWQRQRRRGAAQYSDARDRAALVRLRDLSGQRADEQAHEPRTGPHRAVDQAAGSDRFFRKLFPARSRRSPSTRRRSSTPT